jgi:predicted dinucleotide-binding enzyme
MAEKIGIIGSGMVAKTLAKGLLAHGHEVMIASRTGAKLEAMKSEVGDNVVTGSFADAAKFGDLVVLAVKGSAAEEALRLAGNALAGKTVLDTTNPIADGPPVNGVIHFFTGPNDSLMERLQKAAPAVKFVKAFSCVGNAFMVDPKFPGGKPTMFICGNDADAKKAATKLLESIGWEVADMGAVEAARAIEPLCQLWCIPGIREGQWTHAFKMMRM